MMKKISLIVISMALLVICSCQKQPIKVACVGDSITEGYGLKSQSVSAYPVLLNKELGDAYSVLNFGRSATNAQRTADFPYWIAKEFSNVFALKPDIIVLKLGTNDTKPQNWNMKSFETEYQALIDTFNTIESNPKIFICKPVPVYQTKWGINDSTVVNGVIPVLEKLASKNKLPIIDLYKGLSNQAENFPDFIHPNEDGVENMAKIIAKEVTQ